MKLNAIVPATPDRMRSVQGRIRTDMTKDTTSVFDLPTPTVVVEEEIVLANIARIAQLAHAGDVKLRPHVKTHKSIRFAREQLTGGASGITAAKPSEAMVFIEAGIQAVTLAYPLFDPGVVHALLVAALNHGTQLRLIADSHETVAAAARASHELGVRTDVQLKVDVGLHRCGVDPISEAAIQIARAIAGDVNLRFAGLLSHAGHAYGAANAAQVRKIASEERTTMDALRERLEAAGIAVPQISVGSTPTVLLNAGFDGISEIRPGNYIFMDRTQVSLGAARPQDVALTVISSVVSTNQHFAIIDAGSKVLSSDRGAHGSERMAGFGAVTRLDDPSDEPFVVSRLSEEHGFVPHEGRRLTVGEKLRIVPNHSCAVMNLANSFSLLDASGRCEILPVDARGRST